MSRIQLTRRELAAMLAASTAAHATAQPPAAPADELETARQHNRESAEALAKVSLPMETEPAFHFSA